MTGLQKRNYDAIKRRGLITDKTTDTDFMAKLEEEAMEVFKAYARCDNANLIEELGDVINVCQNWLIFLGKEPNAVLADIAKKNEAKCTA